MKNRLNITKKTSAISPKLKNSASKTVKKVTANVEKKVVKTIQSKVETATAKTPPVSKTVKKTKAVSPKTVQPKKPTPKPKTPKLTETKPKTVKKTKPPIQKVELKKNPSKKASVSAKPTQIKTKTAKNIASIQKPKPKKTVAKTKAVSPKKMTAKTKLPEKIVEPLKITPKKPRKKPVKPIGTAVFRGKKQLYDFKVFRLNEVSEPIEAVYVISKRKTDKRKRGHHSLICIGQTNSVIDEIKKHRKSRCLQKNAANVISILREENEEKRFKIATDLKAAHSISCNLETV